MKINTVLNRNILYLSLVQGSAYILPLLTFPYLVRVLGPDGFGVLGFCQASIQYLVLLTDYGFNWTATQQVAKYRDDKEKLSSIFWAVLWSKFFLALLSFSILIVMCLYVDKYKEIWFVLLSFSPMVWGNVIYPIWFFQGMERMKWITLCSIFSRCMLIPLVFIFVNNISDLWVAALIQGSVNFIAGVIGLYLVFKNDWVKPIEFKSQNIISCLRNGWHVFISTSAISLYTTSTTVILGFLVNPAAVGYFNAANTIRSAVQGLLNPISQALYPRINNLIEKDYSKALELIRRSLRYIACISMFFSCLLFLFAPVIIEYSVGEAYHSSVSILRWMSFLPFIISLSNIFGVQTMLSHNYKKQFSTILITCGICSLFIVFPLVLLFYANGAAISILMTESCVTLLMYLFLRKKKIFLFK
ncbi:flippase [Jinshanibacter sp. LJY008]|uniref:Flippase n=1 Tax=Limnobaculum eriocheiris TaxID=2897391 RepID=A0A9X1SK11_9GAMM|nr:flippase [Limnobaculum eriocheiris]